MLGQVRNQARSKGIDPMGPGIYLRYLSEAIIEGVSLHRKSTRSKVKDVDASYCQLEQSLTI